MTARQVEGPRRFAQRLWGPKEPYAVVLWEKLADGGQMETLMTASVSRKDFYPVVFVLRPAYKPFDNGAEQFYLWYQVTFYVFCQCKPGKSESIDAAYDQAEAIALRILKKLRKEHQTTQHVEFEYNSSALEPVKTTAPTARSASASCSACVISDMRAVLRALSALGRFSVISVTCALSEMHQQAKCNERTLGAGDETSRFS